MDTPFTPSADLLEANRRLYQLRASLQPAVGSPQSAVGSQQSAISGCSLITDYFPSHLGWESEHVTAVLRVTAPKSKEEVAGGKLQMAGEIPSLLTSDPSSLVVTPSPCHSLTNSEIALNEAKEQVHVTASATLKLYPDLALGMIHQGQVPAGRVWLLLRHLDETGCGWLRIDTVREQLTTQTSPHYLFGSRQLRKLLAVGEEVFWHRDKERLWLRSTAHVAVALEVEHLSGQPVALPLSVLLSGVGEVNAHFYASFHSGRKSHNPISRETLTKVTHIPKRTQRVYEKTTGVQSQRNIAIGERHRAENVQKRAWFHGTAVFDFIDHHGLQGPEKRHYVAWHLPNSYQGCHASCAKGRQKKINRQIGLVNQKARGNNVRGNRLFYPDGGAAGQMYNRDTTKDRYWQQGAGPVKRRVLWQVLSAKEA